MTSTRTATAAGGWASAHLPVVVGVDGSSGSRSALDWAADEAVAAGADLRVATVAEHPLFSRAGHHPDDTVAAFAKEVTGRVPGEQVSTAVYHGRAEQELLKHLGRARMLVVGKRGLGTIPRLVVGSTSLSLAGRAEVPVAVVPTGWDQRAHRGEPIVVGLDPDRPHHHLLHLAFRRAHRLGVPLVVVHGWEGPTGLPDPDRPVDVRLAELETEAHERFELALEQWQAWIPDVEVQALRVSKHPAHAVLEAADRGAQLVILGRHSSSRFAGFGFGSVTRAVLHYAEVPVLVVPTDEG